MLNIKSLIISSLSAVLCLISACTTAQPTEDQVNILSTAPQFGVLGGLDSRAYKSFPKDAENPIILSQRLFPYKYQFPIPNGAYELRLHFAQNRKDGELAENGFITVEAEGKTLIEAFPTLDLKNRNKSDITPAVKSFDIMVEDAELTLTFPPDKMNYGGISGIEIIGKNTDFVHRVNCGARNAYTAHDGTAWLPGRELPVKTEARVRLEKVNADGKWVRISDDIINKLVEADVAPLPRWYINSKNNMGVVVMFADRAGNHYANIIGNGIWKYDVESGDFTRIDGGKLDAQINSRSANNGNSGGYIQLVLNPNGAGFAPISWSSFERDKGQVVCTDGQNFINFWQPSDCWDFGTVSWQSNPPQTFFIVHHHSKGEAWLSTDGGQSFEIIFDQGSRVQALGIIEPNVLIKALSREYKGGEYVDNPDEDPKLVGIHRSADLGKTWTKVSDIELRDWKGSMVYYKGDAWFNSPDGLVLSEDDGKTWHIVKGSPTFTQPVVYGQKDNEMMGVNHEGFFFSEDTGRTWKKILDAPEDTGYYFWDPTRDIFYAGQYNGHWYRYDIR